MALANTEPSSFLATRRGKLTLALLCAVAFLDFVDASIVNIALPSIRRALHFSMAALQWVPSGYLLTYGGFMRLGGRAADLLGRRRVLIAGVLMIGVSSLIGGFAGSSGMLIGARLAQGLAAAMTLPAALSILTTSFKEGKDRNTALGVWGGIAALASAMGALLGGLLTEGPGWRWVMFVNPIAVVLVLGAILRLLPVERGRARLENFDVLGAVLATAGMLLLVYTQVKAPAVGWGNARTIGGLAGALALLAAFVGNELRSRNPLAPLSIFRINGLGFSNLTQLIAFAGLLAMFFYLTLYMQDVLHYSPIQTGVAYLPVC
ncbi:MAG: MFS transporter, partial [Solirubrobacterales bacterium]|nr:MFS transporter [Solirubrobacterales bacterium]